MLNFNLLKGKSKSQIAMAIAMSLGTICITQAAYAGGPLPYDGISPPPNITVTQLYNIFSSASNYYTVNGNKEGNTNIQTDVPVFRIIHTFNPVHGMAWGVQLIQPYVDFVGSTKIGGAELSNNSGLAEPQLSAFIKPYNNPETDSVLTLAYFISPPSGAYNSNAVLNASTNNWVNNPEIGYTHILFGKPQGKRLDFQIWGDVYYYGKADNYHSGAFTGVKNTDRSEQLLVYLPYYIHPQTAGYVGLAFEKTWGGKQYLTGNLNLPSGKSIAVNPIDTGSRNNFTRVGIDGGTFLTPTVALQAQLSTDVHVRGGLKNDVYFLLQISKVF